MGSVISKARLGFSDGTHKKTSFFKFFKFRTRLQRMSRFGISDVEQDLYGRSEVPWYLGALDLVHYLIHSCDKVILNPYTKNQVFPIEKVINICSYYIMAKDHG